MYDATYSNSPRSIAGTDPNGRNGQCIPSDTLFGGQNTMQISHAGQTYTLRKTRNGKLILTK